MIYHSIHFNHVFRGDKSSQTDVRPTIGDGLLLVKKIPIISPSIVARASSLVYYGILLLVKNIPITFHSIITKKDQHFCSDWWLNRPKAWFKSNKYPWAIKHGNGKSSIYRWFFSAINLHLVRGGFSMVWWLWRAFETLNQRLQPGGSSKHLLSWRCLEGSLSGIV